jgi:hypothetical protein
MRTIRAHVRIIVTFESWFATLCFEIIVVALNEQVASDYGFVFLVRGFSTRFARLLQRRL